MASRSDLRELLCYVGAHSYGIVRYAFNRLGTFETRRRCSICGDEKEIATFVPMRP